MGVERFQRSKVYQALAFQLTVLLATNHFLAVFFVLPTMPTRRAQHVE